MKKIYLLFILCTFWNLTVSAQQDSLLWSDEFNGTGAPDPAFWSYDLGGGGWGNNEVQVYTNSTNNCYQSNGSLFIKAVKYGTQWNSARIITRNKKSFTYGKIIFRAKLPQGAGTWPALWMLGQNLSTAGWPACGEVDVMESVGKNPGWVHSSLHNSSSYGNTVNTKALQVDSLYTQFHLFEVYWTPDKLQFLVDSVTFYTYNPATKTKANWPYDKPFFFIMNIAMGGNWGSDPRYETGGLKNGIDPSLSSATMEIDYIRVYKFSYPTGIDDQNQKAGTGKLFFSPNPANEKIQLHFPTDDETYGKLYNMLGEEVMSFKATSTKSDLDISSLNKGIYFICAETNGIITTNKLIVN